MRGKNRFDTYRLSFLALLIALQVVLGNLVQIPLAEKQYNLGFLPIAVAASMLGFPYAAIVGALGDFLGAHFFPAGAYFPGFTLTAAIVGVMYAVPLQLCRQSTRFPLVARCVLATLGGCLINWLLNSFWLSLIMSSLSRSYPAWLALRLPSYALELPLQALLMFLTLKGLYALPLPGGSHLLPAYPTKGR